MNLTCEAVKFGWINSEKEMLEAGAINKKMVATNKRGSINVRRIDERKIIEK